MGTQIGNGHTGTEHMTAARWQAVFKSLWGADNVVFKTGSELAITIAPGIGTVTVADGVFSFNGVLGVVETSDTATYVKPASDTIYAKIGVAVRYTKDSGTQVEALDVVCLKSAETASVALAQAETIDYGDGEIETAITEAYYPLCEFIANATGYSELESFVNKVDTLPALVADLAAEVAARAAADTTLQGNINAEATARASAVTGEATARVAADTTLQGNINTEATTRANADTAEATARGAADTALQNNIDALEWVLIEDEINSESYRLDFTPYTYKYYKIIFRELFNHAYHELIVPRLTPQTSQYINIVTTVSGEPITVRHMCAAISGTGHTNPDYADISIIYFKITTSGGVEQEAYNGLKIDSIYGREALAL